MSEASFDHHLKDEYKDKVHDLVDSTFLRPKQHKSNDLKNALPVTKAQNSPLSIN